METVIELRHLSKAFGANVVLKDINAVVRKGDVTCVIGASGSGKSTTLASLIDVINKERNEHIITLEDPIEYLHKHIRSIVNQREIGLKKAIGAKKKRILLQFLTESAVLTSLGGVIGVVSGMILAQVISKIMQIPVSISVPAIGVAVLFSTLIGVIFGMLPAVQAANLNPIEALRRE